MNLRLAITALVSATCSVVGAAPAVAMSIEARPPVVARPGTVQETAVQTMVRPEATSHPAGHVGNAMPIPGLAALNAGGFAQVSAVRCPKPGSCTIAGSYADSRGHNQAFVANEVDFRWGKAVPVPGLAHLGDGGPTQIEALSCPAPGTCTIGGWYVDASANLQAFVASSTNGVFGQAIAIFPVTDEVPSFVARVTALSCATPGNCTAALEIPAFPPGTDPIPKAFLVTQTGGQWGTPQPVQVPGASVTEASGISSISCWSPGDCMAVGGSVDISGSGTEQPIVTIGENGSWGTQNTVPGLDGPGVIDFNPDATASALRVTCPETAACAVTGIYGDSHGNQQAFVSSWGDNHWSTQTIPGSTGLNLGGEADVNGLSCGANGGCAVAGQVFIDPPMAGARTQSFASTRLGGTWGSAQAISGTGSIPHSDADAVSCPPAGSCLIGGNFTDSKGKQQAYVARENATAGTTGFGAFGAAQPVAGNLNVGGTAAVNDVSCPRAGECVIGGFYSASKGEHQGFIAVESAVTATSLTLSAAKVKAGHEHTERLAVQVKPVAGGTPAGKVTITTGRVTVCAITLKGGKGGCQLAQSKLRPGAYKLTARYAGGTVYAASSSPSKTLTVTK